jgi:hypothetical protein
LGLRREPASHLPAMQPRCRRALHAPLTSFGDPTVILVSHSLLVPTTHPTPSPRAGHAPNPPSPRSVPTPKHGMRRDWHCGAGSDSPPPYHSVVPGRVISPFRRSPSPSERPQSTTKPAAIRPTRKTVPALPLIQPQRQSFLHQPCTILHQTHASPSHPPHIPRVY